MAHSSPMAARMMTSVEMLACFVCGLRRSIRTSVLLLVNEQLADLGTNLVVGTLDVVLGGTVLTHEGHEVIVTNVELCRFCQQSTCLCPRSVDPYKLELAAGDVGDVHVVGGRGQLLELLAGEDVLGQLGNGLSVGLGLETHALGLQEHAQFLVVCDDTVVDNGELPLGVGAVRVAVDSAGGTVGGPSGVCNTGVVVKDLGHVGLLLLDELLQLGDLANLLEGKDLVLLVAIDGNTGGVVAAVLETGETCSERIRQLLRGLRAEIEGHVPLTRVSRMNFLSFSTR